MTQKFSNTSLDPNAYHSYGASSKLYYDEFGYTPSENMRSIYEYEDNAEPSWFEAQLNKLADWISKKWL